MKPEDKKLLSEDLADAFKEAKQSFWLKIFPFLEDIFIKAVTKFAERKGWI